MNTIYVMNLWSILQHKAKKFWLKTLIVHYSRSAEIERRKVNQAMSDAQWFFKHKQVIKADNARFAARQLHASLSLRNQSKSFAVGLGSSMMLAFDIDVHRMPVAITGNEFSIRPCCNLEFQGIISHTAHTAFKGRDGIIDLSQYMEVDVIDLMRILFKQSIQFTVY